MIKLRECQKQGLSLLKGEFEKNDGPIKFTAPTGLGRSVVVGEFLKNRRSLVLTGMNEFRAQWENILSGVGCEKTDVRFHKRGFPNFSEYEVIVVCESIREPSTRKRLIDAAQSAGAGVLEL